MGSYASLRRSLIARIEIYDGPDPLPADVIELTWGDDESGGSVFLPSNGRDDLAPDAPAEPSV